MQLEARVAWEQFVKPNIPSVEIDGFTSLSIRCPLNQGHDKRKGVQQRLVYSHNTVEDSDLGCRGLK